MARDDGLASPLAAVGIQDGRDDRRQLRWQATAIGQLLFYTALDVPPPVRIAVLPGKPSQKTADVFNALGIQLISYAKSAKGYRFLSLDAALGS